MRGFVSGTCYLVAVCCSAAVSAADVAPKNQAEVLAKLEETYARIEKSVREMPRDHFETVAVIEQVGRDPEALAKWVRENTAELPYRGALRGAAGVLMERAGNSLDRSLLLAELLESSGYAIRLANATLPKDRAEKYLQSMNGRTAADVGPASPNVEEARKRVRRRSDELLRLIGGPATEGAKAPGAAEAVADHWWVQRQEGGKWLDVELSGVAPVTAARTVPFASGVDRLPVTARDCHEVEMRVVIEAFRDGKLQTDTVLKRAMRPAEVLGRSINFSHFLGRSVRADDAGGDAAARDRFKAALVAQEVFAPTLWIDERPTLEASFTTAGEVDRHPNVDPSGVLAKPAGKNIGGLGGALTGNQSAAKASGVLTAEWLEYEVKVPGQRAQTVRRPVFDLIGPAARAAGVKQAPELKDADKLRRALGLVAQTQIMLQPCEITPDFAMYRFARMELKDKGLWIATAKGGPGARASYALAMAHLAARDQVTPEVAVIRAAAAPSPAKTFIDRPNIVHHRRWLEAKEDGSLVPHADIDLALTNTAVLGGADEAFRTRVEQGVADTLAEHLALGSGAVGAENTFGLFEAAEGKGAAPAVIKPADGAAALAKLSLPPDAAARAAADLKDGNVIVLVSAEPGRWGWWRVDPHTGQTVGVMDSGYNQAAAERSAKEANLQAELQGANNLLKTNVTDDQLMNMSEKAIEEWAKNPGLAKNLKGLRLDFLALRAWNAAARSFIIG